MAMHTTMATRGLKHEITQSAFPSMFWNLKGCRCRQNCLRGMEFVVDVEEYTESWRDGICLECWGRHILSEESLNRGVLWHLLVQILVPHWTKLQDTRQGNASHHPSPRRKEPFLRRSRAPIWDLDRSQEPGVFHVSQEIKPEASQMVIIAGQIWFLAISLSRNAYGQVRCTKLKIWSQIWVRW